MKKMGITLVFIAALSVQVFGQNVEKTLTLLSENEYVENVSVGSFGIFCAKLLGGSDAWDGLKGLKSVEIFMLNDECPADQKTKIKSQLKKLKDDQVYATLIRIKDGNDQVRILAKKVKDTIKEVVVITLSEDETDDSVVMIRLKGNFKEEDLSNLTAKMSNNKGDGR